MKKILILFFGISLLANRINASIDETSAVLQGSEISNGASIDIQDHWHGSQQWGNDFCMNESKLIVKVEYDQSSLKDYGPTWAISIPYTVTFYDQTNTIITLNNANTNSYTAYLSYDESNITSKDIAYYEFTVDQTQNPGNYITRAQVTLQTPSSAVFGSNFPDDLTFTVKLETDRSYDISSVNPPVLNVKNNDFTTIFSGTEKGLSYTGPLTELNLGWNFIRGAEYYDLEWLFIDFENKLVTETFDYDFKNATRVSTSINKFTVPLGFPRGWVLYRVRAVNHNCNGDIIYGSWSGYSGLTSKGLSVTYSSIATASGNSQKHIVGWGGMENSLNWTYSIQFAEGGKYKEVLGFFDGSGRNRQSLTNINTDDKLIIGKTLYDYQGRPAVNVLPSPIDYNGLKYYGILNYSAASDPFDRDEFDLNYQYPNNTIESSIGLGASNYYSPYNPDVSDPVNQNIPDAEGFPYTQVRYLKDGTNRIKEQSGIGKEMAMGSSHTTKYAYVTPESQAEIDRLFGNDVGDVKNYLKTTITDPNGVGAVSYKDRYGRVIATGLIGNTINNMTDVDHHPPSQVINSSLLKNLLTVEGTLESSQKINIPLPRVTAYEYDFDQINFSASALEGLDVTCVSGFADKPVKFDLSILIRDEDGINISLGSTHVNGVIETNITEGKDADGTSIDFTPGSMQGTYFIKKSLAVNETTAQGYRQQFKDFIIANAESCGLIDPFVFDSPCDCANMCDLVIYSEVVGSPPNETTIWHLRGLEGEFPNGFASELEAQTYCEEQCENPISKAPSECEVLYNNMLEDMSPGGQYFDNFPNQLLMNETSGQIESKAQTQIDLLKNDWLQQHVDANQRFILPDNSLIIFNDVNGDPVSGITLQNIRDNWQPSFASSLLPLHPEYCAYTYYCTELACGEESFSLKGFERNILMDPTFFNPLNLPAASSAPPGEYINEPDISPYNTSMSADHPEIDNVVVLCSSVPGADTDIKDYLMNFIKDSQGDAYSIWYFIDDPDDIAGGSQSAPQEIEDLFKQFHGNKVNTGLFYDGSLTKHMFFAGTYLFYRDLLFYNGLKANCQGLPLLPGSAVGGLSSTLYGPEFDDFRIRFSEKPIYENFDPNDHSALSTMASQQASDPANQLDSEGSAFDETCICDKIITYLLQNGHIQAGESFDNISDPGELVTELNLRFSLSITTADLNMWMDECEGTVDNGIEALVSDHNLPLAFMCTEVVEAECACRNLLSLINEAHQNYTTGLSYTDFSQTIVIDNDIRDYIRISLDNPILTIAEIEAWINSCVSEEEGETADLDIFNSLVYDQGFPLDMLCFESAANSCICERLRAYAISESLITEEQGLLDLNPANLASNLNILFPGVTQADVIVWLNTCSETNTYTPSELLMKYNLPSYFYCANNIGNDLILPSSEPCADLEEMALAIYQERLEEIADSLADIYMAAYYQYALDNVVESFTNSYTLDEYYYTLYYYDKAGNLVQTVPPKGVDILDNLELADVETYRNALNQSSLTPVVNNHQYRTQYNYNSLNQMVAQTSPDGGYSEYWYDYLGRLILSRTTEQSSGTPGKNFFSYTVYDILGRISEVGQIEKNSASSLDYEEIAALIEDYTDFGTFLSSGDRTQISFTFYDEVFKSGTDVLFPGGGAQNIDNRVSAAAYLSGPLSGLPYAFNASNLTDYQENYDHAQCYSYDIHGNVKALLKDNVEMKRSGNRFKVIEYEYELISGNVTKINYQAGEWDEFYHKYYYDADNRIARVETSRDNIIWEEDANYQYYAHGPLARTELGDRQVQGLDYAYTVHGWLKGVNSAALHFEKDMGKDGGTPNHNSSFAADVYGFTLGYYSTESGAGSNDYSSIGSAAFTVDINNTDYVTDAPSMYNGNISRMVTALSDNTEQYIGVNGMAYKYDQLNRIKQSRSYLVNQTNILADNDFKTVAPTTALSTSYEYDLNGNLERLIRYNDVNQLMDDLTYQYNYAGKNQLSHVDDKALFHGTTDIGDQADENYIYDYNGNLVKDVDSDIGEIKWLVNGKIKEIEYDGTHSNLEFKYDAMGNRVCKIIKTKDGSGNVKNANNWVYHHYMRDASGTIMGVYKETFSTASGGCYISHLEISELPIYGSSRLGVATKNNNSISYGFPTTFDAVTGDFVPDPEITVSCNVPPIGGSPDNIKIRSSYRNLGLKTFELSNHLGNVLSTISDLRYYVPKSEYSEDFSGGTVRNWTPAGTTVLTNNAGKLLVQTTSSPGYGYGNAILKRNLEGGEDYTFEYLLGDYTGSGALPYPPTIKLTIQDRTDPNNIVTISSTSHSQGINTNTFNCPGTGTREIWLMILVPATQRTQDFHYTIDDVNLIFTNKSSFVADVKSTQDYYPFGSVMPGRQYNTGDYRYGFNGMEGDDEVKGNGNSYDFGGRSIYDGRVARFISVDPKWRNFSSISPYSYAANNPILYVDEGGESPGHSIMKWLAKVSTGTFVLEATGTVTAGKLLAATAGMAVDKHGNVALFYSFGEGWGMNPSAEVGIKASILPRAETVLDIKGEGRTFAVEGEIVGTPLSVGVSIESNGNGKVLGFGLELGAGIGAFPAGFGQEFSTTSLVALNENEYESVMEVANGSWDRAYKQAKEWTALVNEDETIGIWQVKNSELTYLPVEGKENLFEAVIRTNYHFSPVSSDARDVDTHTDERTGVFFNADGEGNLISIGLEG